MNKNFLSNKFIPAAFLASVASLTVADAASALIIKPGDVMSFTGSVAVSDLGGGNYKLDFQDLLAPANILLNGAQDLDGLKLVDGVQAYLDTTETTNPPFRYFDFIRVADLAAGTGSVPYISWLSDIDLTDGTKASFNLTNIVFDPIGAGGLTASLFGDFVTTNGSILGSGGFALTNLKVGSNNTFTADLTPVPTPAAVLPVLAGLLGAASKRKEDQEA